MSLRFLLLLPLSTALAACGVVPLPIGPSDPTAPPPLRAQDAEFQKLAARWFDVWSDDEDVARDAESLYARDADLLVLDMFAPFAGRFGENARSTQMRRLARAPFAKFTLTPVDGLRLRRSGDRAVASATFHVDFRSKSGHAGQADGRTSLIFERREGKWLIVHEHTSIPLIEDWLGGAEMPPVATDADWTVPRDGEFQRLIDEYLAAVAASRTSDATKANAPVSYFAPGDDVVIWDPSSRRPLIGWGGIAAHRDAIDLRIFLTNKQSRDDVRAWRRGDIAWTTFTFTARATRRDGDRFTVVGRQTDVFQKRDGQWRIVHEHASVPLSEEGTPGSGAGVALVSVPPRTTRSIPKLPKVAATALSIDSVADHGAFHDLIAQYCDAWSWREGKADIDRALILYAPEEGLQFIDSVHGRTLTNRAQLKSASAEITSQLLVPHDDLKVFRDGEVAWTTNTQDHETHTASGTVERVLQMHTAIWERREGRWLIVHEHISKMP